MLIAQRMRHVWGYLSLARIYVALVPCQHHYKVFLIVVIDHLIDPKMHTLEALFVAQIVAYDRSCRISIVQADHGPESFTASSVPNVQLHLCSI